MSWTSTNEDPCVGHPFEVFTSEKNRKNSQNHFTDHRMKVSELAETAGISTECVHNILHEHLCLTKLCTDGCRIC